MAKSGDTGAIVVNSTHHKYRGLMDLILHSPEFANAEKANHGSSMGIIVVASLAKLPDMSLTGTTTCSDGLTSNSVAVNTLFVPVR